MDSNIIVAILAIIAAAMTGVVAAWIKTRNARKKEKRPNPKQPDQIGVLDQSTTKITSGRDTFHVDQKKNISEGKGRGR